MAALIEPRNTGLIQDDQPSDRNRNTSIKSNRLPFFGWLPSAFRDHFVAACGEFVGTFLFLFFAFASTQVANTVNKDTVLTQATITSNTLFIALAFGFSLAVNAWVFFRISGGLFNPAVSVVTVTSWRKS